MHKLLVISIASPMLLGVYKDDSLVASFTLDDVASKQLPIMLEKLLDRYSFSEFIYVNSPGSFMALKIAYVSLKTISLIKNIPLKAVDGFAFNGNSPIKAIGKLYFIKEDGTITTVKKQDALKQEFFLPKSLKGLEVSDRSTPKYEIPAV